VGAVKPPLAWNQLKELMNFKYYPRDLKRVKEQGFPHLKQGNLSVME